MDYVKFYRQIQQKLEADKCTTQTQKIYFLSLVLDLLQDELLKDSDVLKCEIKEAEDRLQTSIITLNAMLNENNN